jgi:glycosyltransferase involved in cell wall biosynthesis
MIDRWIVCQIGAREHYAVARALNRQGVLERLVTDAWIPVGHPLGGLKRGLRERAHPELSGAKVWAPNYASTAFELSMRMRRLNGWHRIIARNDWFQRAAIGELSRISGGRQAITVFAYSYAALDIFRFARTKGWRTVLGQIDPGPLEQRIVSKLYAERPDQKAQWTPPSEIYWERWRQECDAADRIVVNSAWSKSALEEEGVDAAKIRVVPLAYEPPAEAANFQRQYPERFTAKRPLRVLFLGQVNLRKGAGPLLDAVALLQDAPVEFWFVGPIQIAVPPTLQRAPNVKWFGPVARSETSRFYREADVFIFPTFSDGFGLTQLEAQAWKLPVIASRFCGEAVTDGSSGVILKDLSAQSIAETLRACLSDPRRLHAMSLKMSSQPQFSLDSIGRSLMADADWPALSPSDELVA